MILSPFDIRRGFYMNNEMNPIARKDVDWLIKRAIEEDIQNGDVTSEAIFSSKDASDAKIISKQEGIFCGGPMVTYVYEKINPDVMVKPQVADGTSIRKGDIAVSLFGPTLGILAGERIALNFLQRMTGIATMTSQCISLLQGTDIQILDTRKTVPGFRILDKYAVKIGGGTNHRMGLFDMVLIKDNHIKAAGSITKAVELVKKMHGKQYSIEVEAKTLDEVKEAVNSGIDIIMLDNMDRSAMISAIEIIDGCCEVEISGNMDLDRIRGIADLEINYISIGALTHSVKAFDLSMKFD
jgi:nicotinate-nucleotide pyrophosphorylase (carboxylating)